MDLTKTLIIPFFLCSLTLICAFVVSCADHKKEHNFTQPSIETCYYAHDTHVARCYRCALGQYVEKANPDFCQRNYGFWNLEKEQVKDSCK